jgi:phosphohistidine phosphatase
MKNLILIRHAKSSWTAPLRDIDRTLEERGVADAQLVGKSCIQYLPETYHVFSSSARRASDTAKIIAQQIEYPVSEITFLEKLYTFDYKKLEEIVRSFPDNYNNVILFGHNEAITNFVNKFGDVFIENVPTSGFVSLRFESNSWKDLGKGKTIKTIFPKDLK